MKQIAKLHYITHNLADYPISRQVEDVCKGGCRWVQLRMKNSNTEERLNEAMTIQPIVKQYGAKLIINDDVFVAKMADADGVHIGKDDMSPLEARKILGTNKIIGCTANTLEDVLRLSQDDIDYIGLGPFRFTSTKEKLSPVLGNEGIQQIVGEARAKGIYIPIVAIGGILLDDIGGLMDTGVHGIAVSGAIHAALNRVGTCKSMIVKLSPNHQSLTTSHQSPTTKNMKDVLKIADKTFSSRLFSGTGKFGNHQLMEEALLASGTELVTVALKRVAHTQQETDTLLRHLGHHHIHLLPNTSGVRNAKEAVFAAQLAREALQTNWLKLEIHPDPKYLMPDPIETLAAAEQLVKLGFVVLPYCHADPVLCKRLEDVGVAAVMPLGAPIGSNKGLAMLDMLRIIIDQANVPVVVDAGIGAPSHAAHAMELGADAVLVNTAMATAGNPVSMAEAFKWAVQAGRQAYLAGLPGHTMEAKATSPLTAFLDF